MKIFFLQRIYLKRTQSETMYGFGLIELILSSSILVIIVLLSVYFTSLRQKVIREAYLTNAIGNEIQRDIEQIRSVMWSNSYIPGNELDPSTYDSKRAASAGICKDIRKILSGREWKPKSSRNKIIKDNIKIIRNVSSHKPLGLQSSQIDNSISRISYLVEYDDRQVEWMNFDIGSEVHSWCPPGE